MSNVYRENKINYLIFTAIVSVFIMKILNIYVV